MSVLPTLSILTLAAAENLTSDPAMQTTLNAGEAQTLQPLPGLELQARLVTGGAVLDCPLPYQIGEKQAPAVFAALLKGTQRPELDERGLFIFPTPSAESTLPSDYEEVVIAHEADGEWLNWEASPIGRLTMLTRARAPQSETSADASPDSTSPSSSPGAGDDPDVPASALTSPAMLSLLKGLSPEGAMDGVDLQALNTEMAEVMARFADSVPEDVSAAPIVKLLEEHRDTLADWQKEMNGRDFETQGAWSDAMQQLITQLNQSQ